MRDGNISHNKCHAQQPLCGASAGKKIKGRKRHALVDTDGRGLLLQPHPASIRDSDGGGPLLQPSRRLFAFIERVFADGGYAGERVATATRIIVTPNTPVSTLHNLAEEPAGAGGESGPRRLSREPFGTFT